MNIKQQLEQVIAYAHKEAEVACVHHRYYAHLEEIASRLSAIVEQMEADEQALVAVHVDALVSLPWRIDQDNDKGLCVMDARGVIVYVEDWGGIPDEMSSGLREQIIEQARANARFMVVASVALAG